LACCAGPTSSPKACLDPHLEGFETIRAAYPWDASALVSSHNDPNPRNILFDGQRLWLVDWELRFRNDPLTDIAILMQELTRPRRRWKRCCWPPGSAARPTG